MVRKMVWRLTHCFKEGELCQNGRKLDVLDEPDRPNPFDLITFPDVDEADNAVFRIEVIFRSFY